VTASSTEEPPRASGPVTFARQPAGSQAVIPGLYLAAGNLWGARACLVAPPAGFRLAAATAHTRTPRATLCLWPLHRAGKHLESPPHGSCSRMRRLSLSRPSGTRRVGELAAQLDETGQSGTKLSQTGIAEEKSRSLTWTVRSVRRSEHGDSEHDAESCAAVLRCTASVRGATATPAAAAPCAKTVTSL
jgi:hypothetical protein